MAIVPAFNASQTVASVVLGLRATGVDVVVVDDGSRDETAVIAADAGAEVVTHPLNLGYAAAVQRGLRHALDSGAKTLITFDADGAHVGWEVDGILARHRGSGAALTIGSRFLDPLKPVPDAKRGANGFAAALVNLILGTSYRDVASGMRVMDAAFAEAVVAEAARGFSLVYQQLSLARRLDARVEEHPVGVRYPASSLWYTKRTEVLDLLDFAIVEGGPAQEAIAAFRARTSSLCRCSIRVGGNDYWFHPVRDEDGFVIQRESGPGGVDIELLPNLAVPSPPPLVARGLHVAIIPDGTRRWAAREGLSLHRAYEHAAERLAEHVAYLFEEGADSVSIFMCSRDNLRRPDVQVEAFLSAEVELCCAKLPPLLERLQVRAVIVGDLDLLGARRRDALRELERATAGRGRTLYLAFAYDAVWELAEAGRGENGQIQLQVGRNVHVLVRTGGAPVLSGFLPLQCANARLHFSGALFNDFGRADFAAVLKEYAGAFLRQGE